MPQQIEVPGMGVVEFPDGMGDAAIAAAIKSNMPAAPASASEGKGSLLGGLFMGGRDVLDAGAQLLVRGANKIGLAPDSEVKRVDTIVDNANADYEASRKLAGRDGIDAARIGGNVVANLALPIKTGPAPGLIQALKQGAKYGAVSGALQPVINAGEGDSFADRKAKDIGVGAAYGAAIPLTLGLAKSAGKAAYSVVQPFTESGQNAIAGKVIKKFADDGPVAINSAEIVPGSLPTLAEATGNAGLATLQRAVRDLRPNAFAERETSNAAARSALFDRVAGDPEAVNAAIIARLRDTQPLLNGAFKDAKPANPQRVVDLVDTILSGPAGKRDAVVSTLSNIKGKVVSDDGLEANAANLYGVRKQIGDLLDKKAALTNPAAQQASRELLAVRSQLDKAIEDAAPGFKNYLQTYAEKSNPVNAMEALQGLRLTDAQGNITLAKVQNAIRNIETARSLRGANDAKAISSEQLSALQAIRDDLLRQANLSAGKSIGSNTFQNLATDNILASALPGKISDFVGSKLGIGSALGQVGKLAYSGPNEAIRNKLADALLSPDLLVAGGKGLSQLAAQPSQNALIQRLAPYLLQGSAAGVTAGLVPSQP